MRQLLVVAVAGVLGVAIASVARGQETPPAAPTDLVAVNFAATGFVGLTWQDNANNDYGYQIERSTVSEDGPWEILAVIPLVNPKCSPGPCYFDTPSENVNYWYRVAAKNAAGLSAYSNVVWIGLPAAPSDLRIEGTDLIWKNNATNAGTLLVQKSVGGGPYEAIVRLLANVTRFALPALTLDEQCAGVAFTLTASNGSGESAPSNAVRVQATDCSMPTPVMSPSINLPSTGLGASAGSASDAAGGAMATLAVIGVSLAVAGYLARYR